MKKVFIYLFVLFLSAFVLLPGKAEAGTWNLIKNAVTWCNELTQEQLDQFASEAWTATMNDPSDTYTDEVKKRLAKKKSDARKNIDEAIGYYGAESRHSQEGCATNAQSIVEAIRQKARQECSRADCDIKGADFSVSCPDDGRKAAQRQHCKAMAAYTKNIKAKLDKKLSDGIDKTDEDIKASCTASKVARTVAIVAGATALAGFGAAAAAAAASIGIVGASGSVALAAAIESSTTAIAVSAGVGGALAAGGMWIASKAGTAIYAGVLTAFLSFHGGCWFCPIYDTIFDTGNELAAKLYEPLRDIALALLAIIAFGWTLFQVLKFITTLHAPNIGEFLTRIFKTLGTVAIMAAFLAPDPAFLAKYFIDVPSLFALDLSDKILEAGGFGGGDTIQYQTYTNNSDDPCAGVDYPREVKAETHTLELCPSSDPAKYAGKPMSMILHDRFICLLRKVSVRLIKGIALGATFVAASFEYGWPDIMKISILPSFSMLFVGIFVFCCYFALFIKIPVYLVDIVLRLCFLIITLPIYVMCFPFPSTRGYTKKAWEMLLSLLVHIISLCIFVSLALTLIEKALALGGQ